MQGEEGGRGVGKRGTISYRHKSYSWVSEEGSPSGRLTKKTKWRVSTDPLEGSTDEMQFEQNHQDNESIDPVWEHHLFPDAFQEITQVHTLYIGDIGEDENDPVWVLTDNSTEGSENNK